MCTQTPWLKQQSPIAAFSCLENPLFRRSRCFMLRAPDLNAAAVIAVPHQTAFQFHSTCINSIATHNTLLSRLVKTFDNRDSTLVENLV